MEQGVFYQYSPSAGIVIPDTDTIREKVCDLFKGAFGSNFVCDSATPAGVLIDSLTKMFAEQAGIVAQCGNGFNINLAVGKWLDAIGVLMNIERHPVTSETFSIGISGKSSEEVLYNKNTVVIRDAAGNEYMNSENFYTSPGSQVTVTFKCTTLGEIIDDFSEVTLQTMTSDLTINSESLSVLNRGAEEESDYEYRARLLGGLSRGVGYVDSVVNAIMAADPNVVSAKVGMNHKCAYIEQEGIVYPPASCCIIVRGATDNNAIQDAIRKTIPYGTGFCTSVGTTQHQFYLKDGTTSSGYVGYWHDAAAANLWVNVTANLYNYGGTKTQYQNAVKAEVEAYLRSLGLGATVTADGIAAHLAGKIGGTQIRGVNLGRSSSAINLGSTSFNIYQYPSLIMQFSYV